MISSFWKGKDDLRRLNRLESWSLQQQHLPLEEWYDPIPTIIATWVSMWIPFLCVCTKGAPKTTIFIHRFWHSWSLENTHCLIQTCQPLFVSTSFTGPSNIIQPPGTTFSWLCVPGNKAGKSWRTSAREVIVLPNLEYTTYSKLGGGFKYFSFSPLLGEDSHFDWYFSNGVETTN